VRAKEDPGGAEVKVVSAFMSVGFLMLFCLSTGCATNTTSNLRGIPDHQLVLCQELGTRQVCAVVNNNRHLEKELLAFKRGYRDYG